MEEASYSSYSNWKRRPFDNRKPWAYNCGIGLVFVVQECHDCSLYLILSSWWLILWQFPEGCNPIEADLEKAAGGQDVRMLHLVLPSTDQSGPGNSFGDSPWPCHLCSSDHHHTDQVKQEQLSESYPCCPGIRSTSTWPFEWRSWRRCWKRGSSSLSCSPLSLFR